MQSSFQTVHILLGCAPISRINERPLHFTVKQHGGSGERPAAACNFSGLPSIMYSTLSLWGRVVEAIYRTLWHGWVTFPNKIITCNLLRSTHNKASQIPTVQMQHCWETGMGPQYVRGYLVVGGGVVFLFFLFLWIKNHEFNIFSSEWTLSGPGVNVNLSW